MRHVILPALLVLAGCADVAPTSTDEHEAHARTAGSLSSSPAAASTGAPTAVFNTQLRAEQEPNNASTSESKGHAQIKVLEDGTMEFMLVINNKSDEMFTRAHIHKAAAGVNGPIHWDFLEAGVPWHRSVTTLPPCAAPSERVLQRSSATSSPIRTSST